jgi:hypothetical protein
MVVLLAWGCDSGPSGPGDLAGLVQANGADLGGAVLQVVGRGIDGFSGVGGSQVYWATTDIDDTYRVIVISESTGNLHFQVGVQDLGGPRPSASVVNLVDGQNRTLPATSGYKVRFTH